MKIYIKQDHLIIAIPLKAKEAADWVRQMIYLFWMYGPLNWMGIKVEKLWNRYKPGVDDDGK